MERFSKGKERCTFFSWKTVSSPREREREREEDGFLV